GYTSRLRDFDTLLRILDGELRLITPTDPESTPSGSRYYQLTHDYLVPSLRNWLTRKQKESWGGRANLRLAERGAAWTARPEKRNLPSSLEWLSIRTLTHSRDWTPSQEKMMRTARRFDGTRGLVLAAVLALVGWAGYEWFAAMKAHALRDRLLDANTTDVPGVVADMAPYRVRLAPLLRQSYDAAETNHDARKQLHCSLALLPADPGQTTYLYQRLLDAEPHEVSVIRDALDPHKQALVGNLWSIA